MPTILVNRKHQKSIKDARVAVEHVAAKIAERFDVEYAWEGNTLHFERSGVDGHIALSKGEVNIKVNLSFLLTALRGPVEREINNQLDREFA